MLRAALVTIAVCKDLVPGPATATTVLAPIRRAPESFHSVARKYARLSKTVQEKKMGAIMTESFLDANKLKDKTILLAGNYSELNANIARKLRMAGANVVFPGEISETDFAFTSETDVRRLAESIFDSFGWVDSVLVGFGGEKGLNAGDSMLDVCQKTFSCHLVSHVMLMRHFKQALAQRGGAYVIAHDRASPHFHGNNVLGTTLENAEMSLARTLSFEAGGVPPYVYTLVLSEGSERSSWLTPANLPEAILHIVACPGVAKDRMIIDSDWRDVLVPTASTLDSVSYL